MRVIQHAIWYCNLVCVPVMSSLSVIGANGVVDGVGSLGVDDVGVCRRSWCCWCMWRWCVFAYIAGIDGVCDVRAVYGGAGIDVVVLIGVHDVDDVTVTQIPAYEQQRTIAQTPACMAT